MLYLSSAIFCLRVRRELVVTASGQFDEAKFGILLLYRGCDSCSSLPCFRWDSDLIICLARTYVSLGRLEMSYKF